MLYPINQSGIPLATERLISRLHIFRTTQPTLTGGTVTLKKCGRQSWLHMNMDMYLRHFIPLSRFSAASVTADYHHY